MMKLSQNIQNEIDSKNLENKDINKERFENLHKIQLEQLNQLEQLQKIQNSPNQNTPNQNNPNQIKTQENFNEEKPNIKSNIMDLIKEPCIILVLFIMISHPSIQKIIGTYISNFRSENEITLVNLIIQGSILVSIYFGLKLFILS